MKANVKIFIIAVLVLITASIFIRYFFNQIQLTTTELETAPVIVKQDYEKQNIIILHSYHPHFTWTKMVSKGIFNKLLNDRDSLEIQEEYLDAKRNSSELTGKAFFSYLREKCSNKKYSVIITSDDIALLNIFKYRSDIFPDTPVVFCGVNSSPEIIIGEEKKVTGIIEKWDPVGTLDLLIKLQPYVKKIFVINDYTESGIGTKNNLLKVIENYDNQFTFSFIPEEPVESTFNSISKLSDDSAVLLLGYNRDSTGRVFDSGETGAIFAAHSPVPVYTMDETRFNGGVIGGSLLSGEKQGETAGEMAVRILKGENIENIPIIYNPAKYIAVDYNVLNRFRINLSAVPDGVEVINTPTTFYEKHFYIIWTGFILLIILSALLAGLYINLLLRHRIELEQNRTDQNLSITLDSIGDAVITTDEKGIISRINPAANEITGYSGKEAIGTDLRKVFHLISSATGKTVENPVETVLSTGKTYKMTDTDIVLIDKHGNIRNISDSAAPIRDKNGSITGVVFVFRDITNELKLQEKLRISQRMELLGQMAGGIAHDFNNILTVILGSSELLEMHMQNDNTNCLFVNDIKSAAGKARELTKDLLTFSRKGEMKIIPINFHKTIEEALRLLERSIDKGIRIIIKLEAENDIIMGDTSSLQSAILNLGINARDAVNGKGEIVFSSKNIQLHKKTGELNGIKSGYYFVLSVEDNGTGMSDEIKSKIFEPYFTTKPVGKGTGLGMASVYGCVKSHNGFIKVYSEIGIGSAFHLYFPVKNNANDLVDNEKSATLFYGEETVLLIDDDEDVRITTSKLLKTLRYKVISCDNGIAAAEYYEKNREKIDIVLLDIIMPVINGYDTFYKLKSINEKVKIILCSGFSQHAKTQELLDNGAVGMLNKPFVLNELSKILREKLHPEKQREKEK